MSPPSPPLKSKFGRVLGPELFQTLRGMWELDGQALVLDVDQETGELMACTQEGEPVDPGPVVTRGTQVRPFRRHPLGH